MTSKILVVEDEPLIALDIKRRLLRLGYEVVEISNSAETAWQAIAQFNPDLVLMDVQLEGEINGIQTANYIRTQYNIPIVFLTAHADEVTLNQAKLTRPFGYIVKPFENHDLSTTIEIALSRHQAEVATQQALKRERELHEIKSRFVSVVSHEFRNPLSVIQFALDILSDKGNAIATEKKQRYIEQAQRSICQMRELLEDILIIGESEVGDLQCQPNSIDLTYFCRILVEELQMSVGAERSVRFTIHSAADNPQPFYCFDGKLLHYILSNLLSNAIKYSPEQSEVKFEAICSPNAVTFRIQDQGIGIPIEDQPYLFNPFYRSSNAKNIPGTGLGLSIVKQCVDAHNGVIAIESEPGVGTTVTVEFQLEAEPGAIAG